MKKIIIGICSLLLFVGCVTENYKKDVASLVIIAGNLGYTSALSGMSREEMQEKLISILEIEFHIDLESERR